MEKGVAHVHVRVFDGNAQFLLPWTLWLVKSFWIKWQCIGMTSGAPSSGTWYTLAGQTPPKRSVRRYPNGDAHWQSHNLHISSIHRWRIRVSKFTTYVCLCADSTNSLFIYTTTGGNRTWTTSLTIQSSFIFALPQCTMSRNVGSKEVWDLEHDARKAPTPDISHHEWALTCPVS